MKISSRQGQFEPMRVDYSARSGGLIGIYFWFFEHEGMLCVSLESPHRGDSNVYTQYTIFKIKKKENHPKLFLICGYGIFFWGLKNKFETAVVNEPSEFEPLKLYCTGTVSWASAA